MNAVIKREYDKLLEAVEELLEGGEDWVEDSLGEAFEDVIGSFELEEFAEKNEIKDVGGLVRSNKLDDEQKKEILEKWAESLEELTSIEVELDFE